ncbi:hypothetical protein BDW68DRAFT_150337 [Aspergillus falconensis]
MNENTIIAIIVIAVLGSIAGGGFYVYYLHANIKKELTIARVESQRERAQQLKAVAATMERATRASQARSRAQSRAQSRAPSRGRSRARSRRQEASLGLNQDQARDKKGKKWKKAQKREQHHRQEDARSRSSKRPMPSRAGSVRPAQGKWGQANAMATTGGQSQDQQGQDSWPAPAPADNGGDDQWGDQTRNHQNNQRNSWDQGNGERNQWENQNQGERNNQNDTWGQGNDGGDGWSNRGEYETQDTPGDGQNGKTGSKGDAWGDNNNNEPGSGGGWSPDNNQNDASGDNWNSGNNDSSGGQQQENQEWKSPEETAGVQQPAQRNDAIDYW